MNKFLPTTTDKTIRAILLTELNKKYHTPQTAIIPEFTLSDTGTRADIAVVNGILHGYELKGDLDNLNRLSSQVEGYNAIFDKITIVVGKKHLLHSVCEIPDWWGVTLAKNMDAQTNPTLIEVRKAMPNPEQDIFSVLNLLWKNEIRDILIKEAIYKNLSSANKQELSEALIKKMTINQVKNCVRRSIVTRVKS